MPSDTPIRAVLRGDLTAAGWRLRNAARYLFARPPGYGWQVAADLIGVADLIDPSHRNEAMSQRGKNINAVLDLLGQAQDALAESQKREAALAEELTTVRAQVPVEDPEDVAAESRLAAVLAPQAPAEPVPEPVPAAPSGVTFDVTVAK